MHFSSKFLIQTILQAGLRSTLKYYLDDWVKGLVLKVQNLNLASAFDKTYERIPYNSKYPWINSLIIVSVIYIKYTGKM